MYDYGYSYGYGLIGGNTYNPLINYDWSTTTTSGLRYLNDVGSTPAYNASMYFGRGAYLNGVDQTMTVPINTTIRTALKRVNGIITINETSQILTNYVISGLGVHKDYYLFTRLLTQSEKDSYTNTPETFYAMAQADSTCVLNMPMCEIDGYVRNMKSYSEVEKNHTYSSTVFNNPVGTASYSNGTLSLEVTTIGTNNYQPYCIFTIPTTLAGTYRQITIDYVVNSGTCILSNYNDGTNKPLNKTLSNSGSYTFIDLCTNDSTIVRFDFDGRNLFNIDFSISVKKLSGAYPITNYTASVRDNAKNLQYGLQTCKFARDSLGVIQSASDYLDCDGVGYVDTGWIPSTNTDWTIEAILPKAKVNALEGIGVENTYGVWLRRTNSGAVNTRLGSSYVPYIANGNDYCLITCTYANGSMITHVDSVAEEVEQIGNISGQTVDFTLGKVNTQTGKNMNRPIRLFKVHDKELTQEEVTANYNSYVAKGLLS